MRIRRPLRRPVNAAVQRNHRATWTGSALRSGSGRRSPSPSARCPPLRCLRRTPCARAARRGGRELLQEVWRDESHASFDAPRGSTMQDEPTTPVALGFLDPARPLAPRIAPSLLGRSLIAPPRVPQRRTCARCTRRSRHNYDQRPVVLHRQSGAQCRRPCPRILMWHGAHPFLNLSTLYTQDLDGWYLATDHALQSRQLRWDHGGLEQFWYYGWRTWIRLGHQACAPNIYPTGHCIHS